MTKRRGWMGIPSAVLAALPACPACYPAYLALLSGLGLGALESFEAQVAVTVVFLLIALGSLAYRARDRRGFAPLVTGAIAASIVLISKLVLGFDLGTYAGVAVLVGASIWNVWPQPDLDCASCETSVAAEPERASG